MFYIKWNWINKPSEVEGIVYTILMIIGCLLGLIAVADSIYEIVTS